MSDKVPKCINEATTVSFRNMSDFLESPIVAGLAQLNPFTAAIVAFLSAGYQQQQFKTLQNFIELVHARTLSLEKTSIDKDFFSSSDGQRIMTKAIRSVLRDDRKEKLIAMANLTAKLLSGYRISIDEKELCVDILDGLNSLQLSILETAVKDMRNRQGEKHRGLGWEHLADKYSSIGVSKPLFLQSIRVLESNGLINKNDVSIVQSDRTHFITDYGEKFCDLISELLPYPSVSS